jgi:hypothetical protein
MGEAVEDFVGGLGPHERSRVFVPCREPGVDVVFELQPAAALYERREVVVDAFFDLADVIITVRGLIRRAWILYRWDTRPTRQP